MVLYGYPCCLCVMCKWRGWPFDCGSFGIWILHAFQVKSPKRGGWPEIRKGTLVQCLLAVIFQPPEVLEIRRRGKPVSQSTTSGQKSVSLWEIIKVIASLLPKKSKIPTSRLLRGERSSQGKPEPNQVTISSSSSSARPVLLPLLLITSVTPDFRQNSCQSTATAYYQDHFQCLA